MKTAIKFAKDVLSHKKILPAPILNAVGLQIVRTLAARASIKVRHKWIGTEDPQCRELESSGCAAFENFLPDDVFSDLRKEFERAMDSIDGPAHDRMGSVSEYADYFGATVRVLRWDRSNEDNERRYPVIAEHFINNPRIMNIVSFHEGHDHGSMPRRGMFKTRLERTWYSANHPADTAPLPRGEDHCSPCGQSNSFYTNFWHRDTFHSITKCFLYMNDVSVENGAFRFAPYSNRLNVRLLKHDWKNSYGEMMEAPTIDEQMLTDSGFEVIDMCFPANTLVVADTGYGFHAKGKMQPDRHRDILCIEYRTSRPFW